MTNQPEHKRMSDAELLLHCQSIAMEFIPYTADYRRACEQAVFNLCKKYRGEL